MQHNICKCVYRFNFLTPMRLPQINTNIILFFFHGHQPSEGLAVVVDAGGALISVLTTSEARQQISAARSTTAKELGSRLVENIPLESSLVCAETDTLAKLIMRLRLSREHMVVVVDHTNRPICVLHDSDAVLVFSKHPVWLEMFNARIWNEWLPISPEGNADSPSVGIGLTFGRTLSWSLHHRPRKGDATDPKASPSDALGELQISCDDGSSRTGGSPHCLGSSPLRSATTGERRRSISDSAAM